MKSIGIWAFNNCDTLVNVTIPDSVESIGNNAFNNCDALVNVTIPDSVTFIGERAFSDCNSLSSVTFGENSSLKSIGNWAFNNCDTLVSITIPDSVESIGDNAFNQCRALTEIKYMGSAEKWNDITKGMAAIPNGVKINHTGSCIDEDTDHICDLCGETVGIHADDDKNHFCDYGCSVTFETHEEAYKSHTCDYCGFVISNCKDDDGNHICDICDMELAHDYSTDWKADGTNHWHECSCGKKKDEAVHSGGTATCTEKAECSVCGELYGKVDPDNHGEHKTMLKGVKKETCTSAGYTGNIHCEGCEEILERGEIIPASGHHYGEWKTVVEATETREGREVKICQICGNKVYKTIPKTTEDGIEEILPGEKSENELNPNTGAPVFESFALISVFAVGTAVFGKRR